VRTYGQQKKVYCRRGGIAHTLPGYPRKKKKKSKKNGNAMGKMGKDELDKRKMNRNTEGRKAILVDLAARKKREEQRETILQDTGRATFPTI